MWTLARSVCSVMDEMRQIHTDYRNPVEEKVMAMKSEIQEMYREPRVERRKPGLKSAIWRRRKK